MRPDPIPGKALDAWQQALGQLLKEADACARLQVAPETLHRQVRRREMIALPLRDGQAVYPAWQFDTEVEQRHVPARAHVHLARTGQVSAWTAASWLVTPHPELDGASPVAFVRAGGDAAKLLTVAQRDAARLAE